MSRPIERPSRVIKANKRDDLPADLVSVIYLCSRCGGKHTYGADYFVEIGVPERCPNCGDPFDQGDQIHRYEEDTPDDLLMKRDAVHHRRGNLVPTSTKPQDPGVIKAQRIKDLEREIVQLKGDQE